MNFHTTDDGRWVLGDKNARCPKCDHEAAVHYAANGRAEVWHLPTDCCAWSREREHRFDRMARADEQFTADMDERAKGWPRMTVEDAA
jgi:hypothetical protein